MLKILVYIFTLISIDISIILYELDNYYDKKIGFTSTQRLKLQIYT